MGMTEKTDGFDKSNPYVYIDRRDACPTDGTGRMNPPAKLKTVLYLKYEKI